MASGKGGEGMGQPSCGVRVFSHSRVLSTRASETAHGMAGWGGWAHLGWEMRGLREGCSSEQRGQGNKYLGLQGVKKALGYLTDQPRTSEVWKWTHSRNLRHGETLVTPVPQFLALRC